MSECDSNDRSLADPWQLRTTSCQMIGKVLINNQLVTAGVEPDSRPRGGGECCLYRMCRNRVESANSAAIRACMSYQDRQHVHTSPAAGREVSAERAKRKRD